jgi:hypothetical protein
MTDGVALEEREESGAGGEIKAANDEAKTDGAEVVVVVVVAGGDGDVAMRREGGLIVRGRSDMAVRAVVG